MTNKPVQSFEKIFAGILQRIAQPNGRLFPYYQLIGKTIFVEFIPTAQYLQYLPGKQYFDKRGQHEQVITIWEDEWLNHQSIIISRLQALVAVRRRIHARQTTVVRLDKQTTDSFLTKNHLQGSTSAYYKYGLMVESTLVAVATFSKGRVMSDGPVYYRSYELERYCSLLHTTITGGLGKLLLHFIKAHHAVHLMTYADAAWSNGDSYLKLGFKKVAYNEPQLFYLYHSRRYAANRLPADIRQEECTAIYNSGTFKFILDKRN